MPTHVTLASLFTDIATVLKAKKGDTTNIVADNFPTEIANLSINGGAVYETVGTQASSASRLGFSNLVGKPKMFAVLYKSNGAASSSSSSSQRVVYIHSGSTSASAVGMSIKAYSSAKFHYITGVSWTFNSTNNSLSISLSSGSNSVFVSGSGHNYYLTYVV